MTASRRPPVPPVLAAADPKTALRQRIADALRSLPGYFESDTHIAGIQATDLFSLNTVLAAAIEIQVVKTLNNMRSVWDPDGEWSTYVFERQAQTFPDVRLVARNNDSKTIALGIELKGWYLLSKEGEPSLRLTTTPSACAEHDLIAVIPWYLSNVLSGKPVVAAPWVESVRYAAQYRNHWWQEIRTTKSDSAIVAPIENVGPYPAKSDMVADKPVSDPGGNFGRLARTGIMDFFLQTSLESLIAGIPAEHWIKFFRVFSESRDPAEIRKLIYQKYLRIAETDDESVAQRVAELLQEIMNLL